MKNFNKLKIILFKPVFNKSISLMITLLIISSILTGTLIIGNVMTQHSRIVKGAEISDRAYFAAESGVERASYAVLKNHQNISTSTFSGTLDNGTTYLINSGQDNKTGIDVISVTSSPWIINLDSGQSFWLRLDLNGITYPSELTIGNTSTTDSELTVLKCETIGSPPQCDETKFSQVTYYDFPQTIDLTIPDYYYKIRINNNSASSQSYPIIFSGSLPIGLIIKSCGTDSDYKRYLNSSISRWEIF